MRWASGYQVKTGRAARIAHTQTMSTVDLHLRTCLVLDEAGRIVSTREPQATRGPLFAIVRSATACAWAVRADLPVDVVGELDRLAREEPPATDLRDAPVFAERYVSLLKGRVDSSQLPATKTRHSDGPAFAFPDALSRPTGIVFVDDEGLFDRHFRGWVPGEIAAGRAPVMAIVEDGFPVSICFCARTSTIAAEAGLETAEAYRGRGYGTRVTAAWALAIRAAGRVPLHSTAWTNHASLAVARKLGLAAYACSWGLSA
jgi:GNAT acetyltransferase